MVSGSGRVAGHGAWVGRGGQPLVVGSVSHYAILIGPGELSLLFRQHSRLDAQEGTAMDGDRVPWQIGTATSINEFLSY